MSKLYITKPLELENFKLRLMIETTINKPYKMLLILTNTDDTEQKPINNILEFKELDNTLIKNSLRELINTIPLAVNDDYINILVNSLDLESNNDNILKTLDESNGKLKAIINDRVKLLNDNGKQQPKKTKTKTQTIDLIEAFLSNDIYKDKLLTSLEQLSELNPITSLIIDYEDLERFNPDIADSIINNPISLIDLFKKAINNLTNTNNKILPRFINLNPNYSFRDVKSKDIGQLIELKGNVKTIDKIRPSLDVGVFECKGCLRLQEVRQKQSNIIVEPSLCSECGGRNFRLLQQESKYYDTQILTIQEPLNDIVSKPREFKVILTNDLVNTAPAGAKIKLTGVFDIEQDKENKANDFIIMANSIQLLDENIKLELTKEDEKQIKAIANKDNILNELTQMLAPNLILDQEIKLGLLVFLVRGNFIKSRDWINLLFIGDPATAKTQMKKIIKKYSNKCIVTSGTGATAKGLTYSTIPNGNNGWFLEAGAYPLANGGHIAIDEFDKLKQEAQQELNEALNDGYVTVNRVGFNTTLEAKAGAICFGNPKGKRFNKYRDLKDQLNIQEDVLSRFDLTFIIKDIPKAKDDIEIFNSILETNSNENNEELLKKYLTHARTLEPNLSKDNKQYLASFYSKLRQTNNDDENIIFINPRHAESLIRISTAIAKLKLNDDVTKEDIDTAITLLNYSLKTMAQEGINTDPQKAQRQLILKMLKNSNSLDNGINKNELKKEFIKQSGYSEKTFYTRFNELINANDIRENKQTLSVYLNKK